MALKPAVGAVKIVDKATRPLESIAKAFNGLNKNVKKTNKSSSSFHKSLSLMSSRLNLLNRSLANGKRAAKGYAGGLAKILTFGGAISGAGLISTLNNQASSLDKLAKKAGNLKLPISELQAMRHQAELNGVSMDDMDASLTRFTKRLGVFQTTGGGAMSTIVKKISPLFAKSLKGAKTNQEAYEILLKTYAKLPTEQAKMALADAAFGDSGRRMLLMLDQGTKGLIDSRKELSDLGAFATEKDTKAAENYNDAMFRIQQAIKGIKFRALTPVLENITRLMTNFTEKFKNADYRQEVIAKVTSAVTTLSGALMSIGGIAKFVFENFNEVISVITAAKIAMFGLNAVMAANPIGLIISGVGLLVTGLGYLYSEFESVRVIAKGVGSTLLSAILFPIRAVLKAISLIPSALIPDSWSNSIKDLNTKLDNLDTGLKGNIKQAVNMVMPNQPTPNQALKALAPTPSNNTANITVNVQDGKVKSVESNGNFKTNAFLNNGVQQ